MEMMNIKNSQVRIERKKSLQLKIARGRIDLHILVKIHRIL